MTSLPAYAELHCLSNFSFLRGASHAAELVVRAQQLGCAALAITAIATLAARGTALQLIHSTELTLACDMRLVLLARNRAGLVNCRQRPETASGVIFVTLEDETGCAHVVVFKDLACRQRRLLPGSQMFSVGGALQVEGEDESG